MSPCMHTLVLVVSLNFYWSTPTVVKDRTLEDGRLGTDAVKYLALLREIPKQAANKRTKQNDICRAGDYLLLTKPDTMYILVYIEVVN